MEIDMKTRHIFTPIRSVALGAVAMLLLGAACSGTEKTEAVTAEIEAAQMEGRNAARLFLSRDMTDTMQMQRSILEAKAKQSKYIVEKKKECAEAFDSSFVSTLRSVRPDLAREISHKVF